MLLLTSTSDIIRVITGSAVAALQVHASYIDLLSGAVTPGRTNTAPITTATTTTVVAAPGASTFRNVKYLSLRNTHTGTLNNVTVEHYDGTNAVELWQGNLGPEETLFFTDANGWKLLDRNGQFKTVAASGTISCHLSSDQSNSTVTPTEVTGLTINLLPGTYYFNYLLRYQAAATTTGVRVSVAFDGTQTCLVYNIEFVSALSTASDANPDQDVAVATAGLVNAFAARASSTAGIGTTLSVDTANGDMLMRVEGMIIVTVQGNIELWHGSEVAAQSTIKSGSHVQLLKVA